MMNITPMTYLIVCPLVFLAGLVDAIGGGGGLISLPAYLLTGLDPHVAIATNKLSSCLGTAVATGRFVKQRLINWRMAVPGVVCAFIGSSIGARVSLVTPETVLLGILIVLLPVTAFIVLNKNLFQDHREEDEVITQKTYVIAALAALIVGFYDGFYGPGTGTFLIIAFTAFAGLGLKSANGETKVINLTTNLVALCVFLLHGMVLIMLGLPAALCNMLGNYIGAGLMMKNGMKIVRPSILIVLLLLAIKILSQFFSSSII